MRSQKIFFDLSKLRSNKNLRTNANMVKVLAIGDLHFRKGELHLADLVIQKLNQSIDAMKPDLIVFLGDTLDTHEKIDMNAFNKAIFFFKSLALKYPIVIIIGNHDRPDATTNLTDNSAFFCLRDCKNIYVVDRVMDIGWALPGHTPGLSHNLRFIFVPFVPPGTFDDALGTLEKDFHDPKNPVTAVFAHQTFVGAAHGKTIVRSGDKWPLTNPLLISGHVHSYKVVQPNLIYAGTPYQLSFDDTSDKGVLFCEFTGTANPSIRFVELDIKKKRIVTLTPAEIDSFVPPPDCEVRIEIVGSRSEIDDLTRKGVVTKMRTQGVSVNMTTHKQVNIRNPDNKPFREILLDSIKDDPEASTMYDEIFKSADQPARETNQSRKDNLSNLMKLMNTMGNPSVTAMSPANPNRIADMKGTQPATFDTQPHAPVVFRPSITDVQKSLNASALDEKNKPAPITIQSLLQSALKK